MRPHPPADAKPIDCLVTLGGGQGRDRPLEILGFIWGFVCGVAVGLLLASGLRGFTP